MTAFVAKNFIEEIQDHISSNSATLGYTTGDNLTVGQAVDLLEEFPTMLNEDRHKLTIFEDGGQILRGGRRTRTERSLRFFIRGDHGQDALNRCWDLLQWFEDNNKMINLTSFVVAFLRVEVMPNVVAHVQDGTALAEFTLTFHVQNKV